MGSRRHARPRSKSADAFSRPRPPGGATGGKSSRRHSLVAVDGTGIRGKIRGEFDRTQRDLQRARNELERFQKFDELQHSRWLHREFGELLTRLRDLTHRVLQAREMVMDIESEVFFSGCSYETACRRVQGNRERAASGAEEEREEEEAPRDRGRKRTPLGGEEEDDDDFEAFFQQLFEELDEEEDPFGAGRARRSGRGKARPNADSKREADLEGKRLKELYRRLVRRLHPDKHREITPRQLELWHQVQAAYAQNDAEQLGIILSICEIEDAGHSHTTSMSILQAITRQFKAALRDIRRKLRECRKHPAWNFSRLKSKEVLTRRTRNELEFQLRQIQCELDDVNALLESWSRPGKRGGGRTRRRRRTNSDFTCPF